MPPARPHLAEPEADEELPPELLRFIESLARADAAADYEAALKGSPP